ncbi:MAG: hypothetical protein IPN70_01770 [Candidatus Moraniibacteriota bacterium]|nr:MAG: hypothetical protein IPN70_01770 [Candidatus Moranbacteria bacterium]
MAQEEKKIKILTVALMSLALVAIVLISFVFMNGGMSKGLNNPQTMGQNKNNNKENLYDENSKKSFPLEAAVIEETLASDEALNKSLEEEISSEEAFGLEKEAIQMEEEINTLLNE